MANEPVSNTPKQSMPHLVTALSASLKAIDEDYKEEMRELRELLEEARKEAEKDEPSSQKLKALLADGPDMPATPAKTPFRAVFGWLIQRSEKTKSPAANR